MGAQLAGRPTGRGKRRAYRALAEINVTPMVDVMLVLLIIFMVAAPLMTVGVPVDLPKTNAPPMKAEKDPLNVSVRPDGRVFVNETEVELGNMVPMLVAISNANPDVRVLVRGDRQINYGRILEVMGAVSAGGFKNLGLVSDPKPTAKAR